MTANIAFALSAAVLSLGVVIASALNGHWWVAAVYALLVAGFVARAAYGRAARRPPEPSRRGSGDGDGDGDGAPGAAGERRVRPARFRRR